MPAQPELVAFQAQFNTYAAEINTSIDGIVGDVAHLNDLIEQLQNTEDGWTPADQAILDEMTVTISSLSSKAKAADELTPPGGSGTPITMSRTKFETTYKGKEPGVGTFTFLAPDNAPLGDLWKQYYADPYVAALGTPVTATEDTIKTSVKLNEDSRELVNVSGDFDLATVKQAQLAGAKGLVALIEADIAGSV